ncbi:MAG: ASKHA domain-containing protein, partial [Promethearchaeota archaeon]
MEKYCKIVFQPSGRRGVFPCDTKLLTAALELGEPIESLCGGKGSCGKCMILINNGIKNVSELTEIEKQALTEQEIEQNYRLACMTKVIDDLEVTVPKESQRKEQIILTEGRKIDFTMDPAVKKYFLKISLPSLEDLLADKERLEKNLAQNFGLKDLIIDFLTLKKLSNLLRENNGNITVTVWNDKEIIDIEPNEVSKSYGLAIDIGTTTVVAYLLELETGERIAIESMTNPQVTYGEDILSRITHVITVENGLHRLGDIIRTGINSLIEQLVKKTNISHNQIEEATIVGNSVMHHLFLKLTPEFIGRSPFVPVTQLPMNVKARDIGININPSGNVHVLPLEAGFVGADNVGVLIASEIYKSPEVSLVIDIGTNGEIVLGNNEKMFSVSCAAGPALEGAHIKFGMRAAAGAIERVRIDENFEPTYKTIGDEKPRGICGSGIIDIMAELFRVGIIEKSGRFADLDTPRLRRTNKVKEYVLEWASNAAINTDIVITQKDIREVQLAKSAMYAGAVILMNKFGCSKLDRIMLAGAFGNYIDKKSAMLIGLYPDCDLERVISIGNAAGEGAIMALLSKEKR